MRSDRYAVIASKLAPTVDLRCEHNRANTIEPCGSELAPGGVPTIRSEGPSVADSQNARLVRPDKHIEITDLVLLQLSLLSQR